MKRIIALLMAIAMCISLCSCGKSTDAMKVDNLISAIGEVTLDSESKIVAAENAVNALEEKEYMQLEQTSVLEEARSAYDELKDISELNVTQVMTLISEIGEVTLDTEDAIKAAKDAYNNLTEKEKANVTNANILNNAIAALFHLQTEIKDYDFFPGVLDFGAYTGVELSEEARIVNHFTYKEEIPDFMINSYINALTSVGFKKFIPSGGATDKEIYLQNDTYEVHISTILFFEIWISPIKSDSSSEPSSASSSSNSNSSSTTGEKNALKKAKSYLDYSSFSYSGLIEQLEFEGFTHSESVYGANNCGADWNEQAAMKAESYLNYSSFSRSGLIEQLEYEGFTNAQAEYGVEANGY